MALSHVNFSSPTFYISTTLRVNPDEVVARILGATSTRYQLQSMLDNSPRQAAKTKSAETFCYIGMIFVTTRTTATYFISCNLFYQHNPPFRPHRQIVSTLLNGL